MLLLLLLLVVRENEFRLLGRWPGTSVMDHHVLGGFRVVLLLV